MKTLQGKKTYLSLAALVACSIARLSGVEIPDEVLITLGGLAGIFMRAGVKKTEK